MLPLPKKDGNGNITTYLLSIGSAEARALGFVSESGERRQVEKTIDRDAHTVTFRLAKDQPANTQ